MTPARTLPGRSFLRTLILAFGAIAALTVVDVFLAKTERAEDHQEAVRYFQQGQRLLHDGRNLAAVESFKSAVSIERQNSEYQFALAEAQLAAGKLEDAQNTLTGILQQDSTNGEANLAMARALEKEGRSAEAISYYHRAVYGQWQTDALENRVKARFELVDLLSRQNAQRELLAELLPLEQETSGDPATRKRIGQLFLAAGSPARAADVFRAALRLDPDDAESHAGLGDAEFARGNYRTAGAQFAAALRLAPGNPMVRGKLELCDRVLALDPTQRGLALRERYARSLRLLDLTLEAASACGASSAQPQQALLDTARRAAKRRSPSNEISDKNLDLAEQLWSIRKKECAPGAPTPDEALELVLAKIAQ